MICTYIYKHTYSFLACVLDPPGKPEVLDVTRNSVSLVWSRPKHDGGSKLIGYYVESLKLPGDKWVRINTSSQNVPKEEYTVSGLEEGAQYKFRIFAKTAINVSPPSEESDVITIIAEHGKIYFTKNVTASC